MPFRTHQREGHPERTKIQFTTFVEMPMMIYRVCQEVGMASQTAYVQNAVCEALARDMGVPVEDLLRLLPPCRGPAAKLQDPSEHPMDRYRHRTLTMDDIGQGKMGATEVR